ncbi:MAG: ketoacyl-ACP synthase III [Candidatus Aminicenantes bacterium]|nr:ketoacyl-ACP synthase III [Candidatus Aminicenantes bacterium]
MSKRAVITGTGHYVPPKVVTNFDLEKIMNTSDEWIRQRSGIVERRYAETGVGSSDLGLEAARRAMENAGADPREIDFVIAATLSPDHYFPGIGVMLQAGLGLGTVGALDVRNQCSGFIYALAVADQFIRTGTYKKILLVAAELQSHNLDHSDEGRDMAVLFGDGAGAVVIEPGDPADGRGVLSTHLFSDGRFVRDLWMENPSPRRNPVFDRELFDQGKFFPKMDGKNVFKNASERMPEAVQTALAANGLTIDDVAVLIPHQANDRISQMVAHKLRIPPEKVVRNIDRFGNTTAASIPIALDEIVRDGRLRRGDLVALTSFGSGFTWASALVRW